MAKGNTQPSTKKKPVSKKKALEKPKKKKAEPKKSTKTVKKTKKEEEIILPREPWEQQEDESIKAFEAFSLYRDMEKRSIDKVAKALSKSNQLISRWSRVHEWTKRVTAWNLEQDRIVRERQIEDIKKMRKRHADLATAMLIKATQALQRIPIDEVKAADVSRMVDIAAKLERISRGDSETIIEERQGETAAPAVTFYMPDNHRDEKPEE